MPTITFEKNYSDIKYAPKNRKLIVYLITMGALAVGLLLFFIGVRFAANIVFVISIIFGMYGSIVLNHRETLAKPKDGALQQEYISIDTEKLSGLVFSGKDMDYEPFEIFKKSIVDMVIDKDFILIEYMMPDGGRKKLSIRTYGYPTELNRCLNAMKQSIRVSRKYR